MELKSSQQIKNRNVAVIGAGYWGKNLVRNFHEIGVLGALCDSNEAGLELWKTNYPDVVATSSVDEILLNSDIQAVAIATPAETHATIVRKALQAGKDVLVEKPLCLSVSEGEKLIALAKERQRVLMVGHLLWYHPAILKLKDLIASGELGRIQYIYSNRLNLGRIRREENILWSFAPHDFSVILGLLGEMPESVQTQGGNYLHEQIADVTVSLLSFPSGVKAHIFVSWLHPYKEQKLVVVGDRKMAVFNDVEKEHKLLLYPHSIDWENQLPVAKKADALPIPCGNEEPLRAECLHFLECVESRKQPRTDGEEGLKVLKVLQQCQDALRQTPVESSGSRSENEKKYMVHESAWIDEDVEIGDGSRIWHMTHILKESRLGRKCNIGQNVVIGPRVRIGNGVKIQNNVSVYEGVTLEDDVFCGPSMVFTNIINPRSAIPRMKEVRPTLVKRGATLGANSTIICGVEIGQYALVGAGAVVTKNVPAYALVVGNPARVTGWVCSCGTKLTFRSAAATCVECKKRYSEKGGAISVNDHDAPPALKKVEKVVKLVGDY